MFKNKNIKFIITFLLIILVLIPLGLSGVLSSIKASKIIEKQLKDSHLKLIMQINKLYIEPIFSKIERDLNTLSKKVDLHQFYTDRNYWKKLFNEWQIYRDINPFIEFVYLGTENNLLLVNPKYTPPEGFITTQRPWYITALKNKNKVMWTKPYKEAKTKQLRISAVKYIYSKNNEPPGVLAVDLSLIELKNILNKITNNENMKVIIVDNTNKVLMETDNHFNKNLKFDPIIDFVSKSNYGSKLFIMNDEYFFISFTKIKNLNWKLVEISPIIELNKKIEPIQKIIFYIAILSTIITVIVGIIISNKVLIHPIQKIKEQTEEISKGNFDKVVELSYIKEFQSLANSINRMRLTIKEQIIDLKKAKEYAEKVSNAKGIFLADMSHEIRTPLNGLIGFAKLLLLTKLNKKQKDYVEKINNLSLTLLDLINNILDFSKIEADMIKIEKVDFNIKNIIRDIHNIFENKIKEKKLKFNIFIDKNVPENLMGDPLRLKQILINLINNAIKFTERGSITLNIETIKKLEKDIIKKIELEKHEKDQNKINKTVLIKFSVTDTGIGMTEEQQKKIFKPFEQAYTEITRKYGGTGLGLSISKRLVSLMGGNIEVKSKLNSGTTFYFTLPFEVSHNIFSKTEKGNQFINVSNNDENKSKNKNKSKNSINILIIEDNEINQQVISEFLTLQNYSFEIVDSGKEALEKLKTKNFNLIFMDLNLPDIDGISLTKIIRKELNFKKIPIVALTAHVLTEYKEKCIKSGMNDFLNKPFLPEQLFTIIEKYINNNQKFINLKNNSNLPSEIEDENNIKNPDNENYKNILKNIKGLDVKVALSITSKNYKIIIKLILNFYKMLEKQYKIINKALDTNNIEELLRIIHNIKGSSGMIGLIELSSSAELLEKVLKEKKDYSKELEEFKNQVELFLSNKEYIEHLYDIF